MLIYQPLGGGGSSTVTAQGGGSGPPNPNGRHGSPEHQAEVQDIIDDLESRGLGIDTERRVGNRWADAVGVNKATNAIEEIYQVGRQTKGGIPVSRERAALVDIITFAAPGTEIYFRPYN